MRPRYYLRGNRLKTTLNSQLARRSSRAQSPWDEPFALEEFLLTVPDPAKTREWSIYYTSQPHYLSLGLPQGLWTQDKWQEFGVNASIKDYPVDNPGYPLTVPKHNRLALLDQDAGGRVLYEASLVENSTDVNPLTGEVVIVPPFLSFSPSCNLNASVVYANFGTEEDFEDLARANNNVTGKLALIKTGKAQGPLLGDNFLKTGLAGYITYPDPQQDGEFTEDNGYLPYPNGPARAPSSVFRQGGPHALLPISYADAIPILQALNGHGPQADELGDSWKGGRLGHRGVEYNVGPTPSNAILNMHIEMEETQAVAYDVVGKIKGEIEDEVVIIGNPCAGLGFAHSAAVTLHQYIGLIEEQADEAFGSGLGFDTLYGALSRLHSAAVEFDTLAAELRESESTAFDHKVKIVNAKYRTFERQFYRAEGNGVEQSNKNIIFQDSSYRDNKPGFAGLANSVESGDLDEAEEWLNIIQPKIEDAIGLLEG